MKKNVIFDFDGVILNSHKVKTDGFYELFKKYGKIVAQKSKKFHLNNIGKNRYYKFEYIYKNYLKKKINIQIIKNLDKEFDQFVISKINALNVSTKLKSFLRLKKKYNFYISTSTPTEKIKRILKEKKIFNYFDNIYGSPKKKIQHIISIKKNKKMTVFIGDSIEDFYAAKKTNIKFLLKNNSENKIFRKKNKKLLKINSFKNLDKIISSITNEKKI